MGAKVEIYLILRRLAAQGLGILFSSSETKRRRRLQIARLCCAKAEYHEFSRSEITDEALFAAASPVVNTLPTSDIGAILGMTSSATVHRPLTGHALQRCARCFFFSYVLDQTWFLLRYSYSSLRDGAVVSLPPTTWLF